MQVKKKVISSLTKCYSIAPLHYHNRDYFLVAAEKQDPCYLFDMEGNRVDTIWEKPKSLPLDSCCPALKYAPPAVRCRTDATVHRDDVRQ